MIRTSLLLFFFVLSTPWVLTADEPPAQPETPPEEAESQRQDVSLESQATTASPDAEVDPDPVDEGALAEEGIDPCRPEPPDSDFWLDTFRARLHRSACRTGMWFDGFFGDERYGDELDENYGRLTTTVAWDEDDNLDFDVDLDAQLYLPHAERRWRAFLGRDNEEEFVANRGREELERLPEFFDQTRRQEWLLGLGYRPAKNDDSALDVDAGVKVDFPLDPFVRVRHRKRWFLGDASLVRVRHTAFWRNQKGFGITHNTDFEQVLSPHLLWRWANYATWSESTRGADWLTAWTLYHNLGDDRALAYQASIRGESDLPVNVGRYTVRAIYRQRWLREWFFFEGYVGMTWPRDPYEERRESAQVGISFEMRYGAFRD